MAQIFRCSNTILTEQDKVRNWNKFYIS